MVAGTPRPDSPLSRFWDEFRNNRVAIVALGVVVAICLLALARLVLPDLARQQLHGV